MPIMPAPPKKGSPIHKLCTVLLWAITLFMLASGIVFLPSPASIPMIAFACVCVPLEPVQDFWRTIRVYGTVKLLILVILFALSVNFYARFIA